jgi:ferredoxin
MTRRGEPFVLKVNPILCDGFGHCHELAPDLVRIDEWGYPILRSESTSMSERGTFESARLAVRGCPRQALRIERTSESS